ACPDGNRCRHLGCRLWPTGRGGARGSYGRAGGRPPCSCAPGCGTARRRGGGWRGLGGGGGVGGRVLPPGRAGATRGAGARGRRLVAVAAGHAGGEHFALFERAVIVGFLDVAHLSIGLVEPARHRRDDVRVGERAARQPVLRDFAAARVATPAGLDLLAQQRGRIIALRIAALRIATPGDVAALVEAGRQALGRIVLPVERPPALLRARPGDVMRPLPVAGLAADADLRPGGGEAVGRRIVIFARAGRMALGAHEVPVLIQPGPVQHVVVLDLLVGIEVEPALPALLLRSRVPGDRERLQPAVGERDQILLQRVDPEGVFDLEGRGLAVGTVGLDHKFAVPPEEARADAVVVEARLVEIAEDGLLRRVVHGELVLRFAPQVALGAMAAGTGLAADEVRRTGRGAGAPPKDVGKTG